MDEISGRISVVIPTYRMSAFIGDALASLATQAGDVAEVIVVDAGEDDGIEAALAGAQAGLPPIQLVSTDKRSPAASRNIGLGLARGEYIQLLDADDLLAPGKLARQLQTLRSRPDLGAIGGHYRAFEALRPGTLEPRDPQPPSVGYVLSAMLFRRSLFGRIGGFCEELRFAEDRDLLLRMLEQRIGFVFEPQVALYYRRHPGSLMLSGDQTQARLQTGRAMAMSVARRRKQPELATPPALEALVERR